MKKTNLILSLILAVMMIIAPQTLCFADETETGEVKTNSSQSVSLISDGFSVDKSEIYAGDTFTFKFGVKNSSKTLDIKNINIRLSGGDTFTVSNDVDTLFKDTLPKNSANYFTKSFFTSKSAEAGMYPISVSATYEYTDDGVTMQGSAEFSYSVEVKQSPTTSAAAQGDTPSLTSTFSTSDKNIQSGDKFKLNFKLMNKSSQYELSNINVRLSGGEAFSIASDVDTIYKEKIDKSGTISLSKQFICSKTASSGMYPITASVTFEYTVNGEKQQGTAEFTYSIKVTKKASAKKSAALTPQIIVSSFSYGKESITGGKSFTLTFGVKNNSNSVTAQNVLIKLSGGETFVVADGTDTISIKSIKPGSTVQVSKKFSCLSSASSGVYPVTANVSYEYTQSGKQSGTNELTMSIPVVQPDKVQFQNIDLADKTVTVSEETDCAFSVINTGQTKLSNGTVKLLDEDGKELNSAFIGNIEAGSQFASNYTLPVTFDETGTKKLTLVFEYENENLEKKSIEQEFKVTVEEYSDPFANVDDGSDADAVVDDGSSAKKKIIIGVSCGAGAVVIIAAVIIIVKKKKHKKGVTFDEKI